jgi:toxin-antitoxin system PIN domain toxin
VKHLLDVNLLIAANVKTHVHHTKANAWLANAEVVLCPIVELGFLRITTSPKSGIGLTMAQARTALEDFVTDLGVERIADDLPALGSHPRASDEVTDHYLADLAAKHGMKLATLDAGIKHPAAELVQ